MKCQKSVCCTTAILALIAMTGCAEDPTTGLIPGAVMDAVGGPPAGAMSDKPCGYDLDYSLTLPFSQSREHWTVVITYNEAGLDVLEEGVDDNKRVTVRYTTEYNAMGQPLHFQDERPGATTSHLFYVYDSFGRLIRYSGDNAGDSKEEWVATYAYGEDERRLSAPLVLERVTYDRTYRYDDHARLIQTDRDNGPDGTIDEVTRFEYDDRERLTTKTVTNSAGKVIVNGTISYDSSNHLISSLDTYSFDDGGAATISFDYRYNSGRLASQKYEHRGTDAAGAVINHSINEWEWRYSNCR
jgi:hypothetical protein